MTTLSTTTARFVALGAAATGRNSEKNFEFITSAQAMLAHIVALQARVDELERTNQAAHEKCCAFDRENFELRERIIDLQNDRAALQSEVDRLRLDRERYQWLANRVCAPDYGDNDANGQVGWRIVHDLLKDHTGRQPAFMYGDSIDAAIDQARGRV